MLILIAIIYNSYTTGKENPVGYRVLDTDSETTFDYTCQQIMSELGNGKDIKGIGLDTDSYGLTGTNGQLSRYPKLVNGVSINNNCIIIFRSIDDKYIVTGSNGKMLSMTEASIIEYGLTQGIANGKVVEKDGTKFLSSISGEYEKDKLALKSEDSSIAKTLGKMRMVGLQQYKVDENGLAYRDATCTESPEIVIFTGVKGVRSLGFANCGVIESLKLERTVTDIGEYAFKMCKKLKNVEMSPETDVIPTGAFYGCTELTSVDIPNGVKRIKCKAFYGCKKLKQITVRPGKIIFDTGAIPSGCRVVIRNS